MDGEDKRFVKGFGGHDTGSRYSLYESQHVFQEYTYKKITPCDVCREVLKGKLDNYVL